MSRPMANARLFAATVRDSVRLFALAPVIVLVAFVPEFLQHVAEVQMGLFDSDESFDRLSLDPGRLQWGYFKVLGVSVSAILAARFWVNRADGRPWWSLASIAWKPFLTAFALMTLLSLPVMPGLGIPPAISAVLSLVVLAVTLPLVVLAMAGLLGDRELTLARAYREGWGRGLRIILFVLAGFLPLQALHMANHVWALGAGDALLWALMIFDSLLVGLIAALQGTAMHHGYMGHADEARGFTSA